MLTRKTRCSAVTKVRQQTTIEPLFYGVFEMLRTETAFGLSLAPSEQGFQARNSSLDHKKRR